MKSFPLGNLCAGLPTATKTTTKISKTTDDDWCCEENLFLGCINYVSCTAGVCVESDVPLLKDLGGGKVERCISFAAFGYASTATCRICYEFVD